MKLIKSLLSFIATFRNKRSVSQGIKTREEVDLIISQNELLVRAIIKPLMYDRRKKILDVNAVLPPFNACDVSLLRHAYSSDSYCKIHGKSLQIPNQDYCGLATFYSIHVDLVSSSPELINAKVKATPLDEHNNERVDSQVFVDDAGSPFHASIIYEAPPRQRGEPNAHYVLFAKELLTKLQYFHDPTPEEEGWKGDVLTYG